jgi:acylphosphatase/peptidoglycan hydrolase CwlO-like protein
VKAKITIKGGRVQDVGYRLFLLSRAHSLKGFEASNLGEDLIVLVEGDENFVDRFVQIVKSEKPPSADVSEVVVEGYGGEVMNIKEYREQLSLEQLVKIAMVGVEMRDDIKEMKGDIKEMKGDMKEMKGDIKTMLKKQDETLAEIRATRNEIIATRNELREEIRATRGEIKALREDLKQYMDRRFEKLEREIALIKQKIGLT